MIMVETYDQLLSLIDSTSISYIGFRRKSDGQFHEGHEQLISYAKSISDITVVTFWDVEETVNYFYGDVNPVFGEVMHPSWDSTACLSWCESQGVDFVFIPQEGYSETYFEGSDTTALISWVDSIWQTEGYGDVDQDENPSEYNSVQVMKAFAISKTFSNENWTHVASWKDGKFRFIMQDFLSKYTDFSLELIAPIQDSTSGLYFSTNYFTYTQEEKNIINQIPAVVDTTGYDNIQLLMDELNALDTGVGFEVYRIEVTIGGVVGSANDFISVYFKMGPDRVESYPIFKEGVR